MKNGAVHKISHMSDRFVLQVWMLADAQKWSTRRAEMKSGCFFQKAVSLRYDFWPSRKTLDGGRWIVWVLTQCEAWAGDGARVWLAASSQTWEVNNLQCDCSDLYRTAVKGSRIITHKEKWISANSGILLLLFFFTVPAITVGEHFFLSSPVLEPISMLWGTERGSKKWNPRPAPAFISGVPVI